MTTVAKPRLRVKPPRTLRLWAKPGAGQAGVLDLTIGKTTSSYFIAPIPSDFGIGIRFDKYATDGEPCDRETYHVCIDPKDARRSTCECKGFLRWGTECKHIGSAAELLRRGTLVPAAK